MRKMARRDRVLGLLSRSQYGGVSVQMANRWQIRMKNKDENCWEGEALGAALGMGSGEGVTFPLLY